jgi:uncharacterized membrane protein
VTEIRFERRALLIYSLAMKARLFQTAFRVVFSGLLKLIIVAVVIVIIIIIIIIFLFFRRSIIVTSTKDKEIVINSI